jgi:hypothetical protein
MICLNIEAFLPLSEFNVRMVMLIAELKSVPLAKGFDGILYPGEIEIRNEKRHLRDGVQLPDQTLVSLAKLARETGLESRLPFEAGDINLGAEGSGNRIDPLKPEKIKEVPLDTRLCSSYSRIR